MAATRDKLLGLFLGVFCTFQAAAIAVPQEPIVIDVPNNELEAASSFLSCLNTSVATRPLTLEAVLAGKLPALEVLGLWWPETSADAALTFTTQLSLIRLKKLGHQCELWPGPLSAVVYVDIVAEPTPDDRGLSEVQIAIMAVKDLVHHVKKNKKKARCSLSVLLVMQRLESFRGRELYPVNALRNYAILQARTPLVAILDVDMLPSASLVSDLGSKEGAQEALETCGNKTVIVMPAFELKLKSKHILVENPVSQHLFDHLVLECNKACLKMAWRDGKVQPFNGPDFGGHKPTDYDQWFAKEDDKPYRVNYQVLYEPWYIANRRAIPWFDVRFQGYGKNKMVQVASLNYSNFVFLVHGHGFLLHRDHIPSLPSLIHNRLRKECEKREDCNVTQPDRDRLYNHNQEMWDASLQAMGAGTYKPTIDRPLRTCLKALPWWA